MAEPLRERREGEERPTPLQRAREMAAAAARVAAPIVREEWGRARASVRRAGHGLARVWAAAVPLLWPPRPRIVAAGFAALVVALGAFGLEFYARLPSRLPSGLDWRAASILLERDAQPGDAVALSPMWAERARLMLPPTVPVMAFPRYAGEDLVGVRRIWLLSLPDAPGFSSVIEDDLVARAGGFDGPQRLGAIEVTRYDLRAPTLPLAFLPDRLDGARVSLGERACVRVGGVFRCPGPPWVHVAREVREIEYLPRPCLYAHPGPDPRAPLTIELPSVPMGRRLRGHTGIIGDHMLRGESPVRLAIRVDGQDLGTVEEPPATPGWHPFELDTARDAGHFRSVTFAITAEDASERLFCFDAMTLP